MYNTDLIIKTFENSIGKPVRSIYRYDNVPNNQVYRIETDSRPFIFKIYAQRDWPEEGKLPFVHQKLDEYSIPHARLYAFNREDDNFPNGYLIEEFLPGVTADRLTLSHDENIKLFEKLGALMSKVHQIKVKNYGYTGSGIGIWTSFSEFIYDIFDDATSYLREENIVEAGKLDAIRENLRDKLKACDCYSPVICHGDLSTKNILVHKDEIVLIDWDDVQSLCWMADIARMTTWMKLTYDSKSADAYRKAFLDFYETEYDKSAFDKLEDALHVWYCIDYLNFAAATPNYHHQFEAIKRILQNALYGSGIELGI